MKKVLLMLLIAVASLTACKKDSEDKLKGRWDLAKTYSLQYENGIKTDESTETLNIGELYIVFNGNGYTIYEGGDIDDSGTFSATEDSIILTSKDGDVQTSPLKWNSKTEFVVSSEDSYTFNGKTYSYKEESTFKKN